jgi:hypothetical protein
LKKTKRRKEYDRNKVFHNVQNAKLPEVESMVDVKGKAHQVRCKL